MKYLITFHDSFDFYEVIVEGRLIRRITRYLGDSQVANDCSYDSLPPHVQDKITKTINEQ